MSSPELLSGIPFLTIFLLFVQNTAEHFFYISLQMNNFALKTQFAVVFLLYAFVWS